MVLVFVYLQSVCYCSSTCSFTNNGGCPIIQTAFDAPPSPLHWIQYDLARKLRLEGPPPQPRWIATWLGSEDSKNWKTGSVWRKRMRSGVQKKGKITNYFEHSWEFCTPYHLSNLPLIVHKLFLLPVLLQTLSNLSSHQIKSLKHLAGDKYATKVYLCIRWELDLIICCFRRLLVIEI